MSLTAPRVVLQARLPRGAGLWPALVMLLCIQSAAAPPLKDQPHVRRPIAAAWIEPGKLLAVANSRSGSVSIVNIPGRKVLREVEVGKKLADITAMPTGGKLLAVDEQQHELIVLDWKGDALDVVNRVAVSPFPVSVAISPSGEFIVVASLWSRKLTVLSPNIDLPAAAAQLRCLAEIDLPFNPRKQLMLPGNRLTVADAFSGSLAAVDLANRERIALHHLPGSIRAMAATAKGEMIVLAMQSIDADRAGRVPATGQRRDTIANPIHVVPTASLFDADHPLPSSDYGGYGAGGDVEALLLTRASKFLVAIAGKNQIAVLPSKPIAVGRRPVALLPTGESSNVIAVNSLSDSISLVGLAAARGEQVVEISLGPAPEPQPAERGEALFYASPLTAQGWMSCHSCHTGGHTSGQLADTLGDDTEGTPKRIPTLLGTRLTDPWAWNGQVRSLNEQVRKSLETTMHATNVTPQQVDDITAFLHTLPPPPPLGPATEDPADKAKLARGEGLFKLLGCAKCHVPPLTYTSSDAYDVGLADEQGLKKFNPPSLRGVSQGYSFFHDGRAKKLEDVFTVHGHQLHRALEKDELADLLRFLRSL